MVKYAIILIVSESCYNKSNEVNQLENMLKLIVEKLEAMESKIDKLETGQQEIKEDLKIINKKLDNIFEQVAGNTEKDYELDKLVHEHDTDIKLLKKLVSR